MVTKLSSYAQQFDGLVRPILAPLDAAIAAVEAAPRHTPGTGVRGALIDVRHHLHGLCDKVQAQLAYVLIFGPLKSGKSTLMNAIAGAYVSEVSSLPAYPCLVFVGAGPRREYTVTRFDGKTETFTEPVALHEHIEQAHVALADAIRAAEAKGLAFDPAEHFPAAIRRVEVRVPDSKLVETGAVLVDTPGLYTRMRFGYDRMTRDFRDAAACAIFVVRSDTLFLEQVFAEFHQLLDLFSRIFLVVNVDAQKRDVGPDGKLVPSLEQSQPELVLAAFEKLAMSAPLQKAAAEGRLRMYPVDLLHAASSALQKQPEQQQPPGFVRFQKDLADFLASSEYLAAFLRDSLQRALKLAADAQTACAGGEVASLRAQVTDAQERLAFVQAERQRLQLALLYDWSPAFARSHKCLEEEIERTARDEGHKLMRSLGASIDTWFLSSHSLDWLCTGQWTPLVQDYRSEVLAAGRRALEQSFGQAAGGIDVPEGMDGLLHRAGIDLRALRQAALRDLPLPVWKGAATVAIDVDSIPVRRGVLDVVAFRSADRVRHRLFGDKQKPDAKIQAKDKAARLGEAGRLHLHQRVTQFRAELAPATVAVALSNLRDALRRATVDDLLQALRAYEPRLKEAEQQLEQELATLRGVLLPLQQLLAAGEELRPRLEALGSQFGAQFAKAPAGKAGPVLHPEPRRTPPQGTTGHEPRPSRADRR